MYSSWNTSLVEELIGPLEQVLVLALYPFPDPSPDRQPYYDQQRSALAVGHGRVYVTFGGHYGDCGPYVGSVVGMPIWSNTTAAPANP